MLCIARGKSPASWKEEGGGERGGGRRAANERSGPKRSDDKIHILEIGREVPLNSQPTHIYTLKCTFWVLDRRSFKTGSLPLFSSIAKVGGWVLTHSCSTTKHTTTSSPFFHPCSQPTGASRLTAG